ncbi:unnamed protein product, partial [Staurois parvus]
TQKTCFQAVDFYQCFQTQSCKSRFYYKQLVVKFFFNSSVPDACPETFFHHEMHGKRFQGTQMETKHGKQDVFPTKLVMHYKDQCTPQTSPTLGTKKIC